MHPIFAQKLYTRMHFLPTFELELIFFIFLFFASMAFLNLLYTFFINGRLAFYKDQAKLNDANLPPISIILAARNESDNLFENLPYLLQQNYPEFEVIVINHQSVDDSAYLLNAYSRQYSNLHIIEVPRNPHLKPGKKLPITLGIKGAKYEHLVFTDADCKPDSNIWLKSMASRFIPGKELVIGYGPYNKGKGFLNRLIRFDTAWIGVSYFSMALSKLPYMGVGRNMAYTKTLFNAVHGFKSHYALPSGDDDLFIQESAKKNNYSINLDQHSFCYSDGSSNWEMWIRQKSRHYSTSSRYKVIKKWMLGIYPLTMLMLLFSFVILMFNTEFRWLTLSVFIFTFALKWWIQARCFRKLKETSFIKYLPLWDIFYAFLIPVIYYSSEKKEPNKW
jgi:cellulose synthase/poly-beta-1,6-N-acetylglucosamine synthase-like glycosyltransferase